MFKHETSLISVEDIVEVLGRMKKRRACADDNVVAEMLQSLPMDAVVKLAALINDTLGQRVPIPSSWSTLQAIQIPKHDSATKWSDLRPTTICPTLCKVWDAVLLRNNQNSVLPSFSLWQFAFMPGRSIRSPTAITSLLGEKTREWGQKMFVMKSTSRRLLTSCCTPPSLVLCSCMTCPRSMFTPSHRATRISKVISNLAQM